MKIQLRDLIAFNLDAGGGAGGGAAGGGQPSGGAPTGGAPSQQPSGQQPSAGSQFAAHLQQQPGAQGQGTPQGSSQQPPAAYYPEGLADNFRGANDRETIDKLFADFKGRPTAPAKAADYKLELGQDFTAKFGDLKDDPVVGIWRDVAHKIGLSNQQFTNVIPEIYAGLEKAGLIEKPTDFNAEAAKLAPGVVDVLQRNAKAAERVNGVANVVKNLEAKGQISKADAVILSGMYANADAVAAFEKIIALIPKELGLQSGGQGQASDTRTPYQKALASMYPSMVAK